MAKYERTRNGHKKVTVICAESEYKTANGTVEQYKGSYRNGKDETILVSVGKKKYDVTDKKSGKTKEAIYVTMVNIGNNKRIYKEIKSGF